MTSFRHYFRQQWKPALAIFEDQTIAALEDDGKFDTAEFAQVWKNMIDLLTTRSKMAGKRARLPMKEPITSPNDPRITEFIPRFVKWLQLWNVLKPATKRRSKKGKPKSSPGQRIIRMKGQRIVKGQRKVKESSNNNKAKTQAKDGARLTQQTLNAIVHTLNAITQLVPYIFEKIDGVEYLLLGKFTSDFLENHFGWLRVILQCCYAAKGAKFMCAEKKIRTIRLIKVIFLNFTYM